MSQPGSSGIANPGNSHHTAAAMAAANMSATSWANSNEWDKYREIITDLYRDRGLHLKKVQSFMAKEYNFHASERMYKTRISKWNLDKNLKAADVMVMFRMYQTRAMVGKKSRFTVRGRYMDYARVEQYIRRDPSILTRVQNNEDIVDIPPDHAQSAGIMCRTPSPSPPPSPAHGQSVHVQMPHHLNPYHHSYGFGAAPPQHAQQHAQHHHQQPQHSHNGHRRPHPHVHGVTHHPHHPHHLSSTGVPVLPSQSQAALHQMQLPVATTTMAGYPGMTTTSGPSGSSYTSGSTSSSSPFSSLTATSGVATSPFALPATMGDSSSGFASMSATSNNSNSAYEFSAPGTFGTSAPAPGLTTSASPSSLGMMPTHISTPRTINTDGRFGSHSFAPMTYSSHGQSTNGQVPFRQNTINGIACHDQYGEHVPQNAQGHQQGSSSGIGAASGSQYSPYGSAPNGSGVDPTHGSSSASGHGSNPNLPDTYDWNNMSSSNPPWGGQFR
ncbi:hypothetical protein F503_02702 [Ophiostoma piceae UAMH 11346]|uniref:Clr5 domain-containing protein n=1 Tax=Ophiostoma piceae (strain UAMH 11346) TaxID=1262450 RepID=S3BZ75_OPHP1|nr:hypothetical protein F503_02702 [Ophiostoma piceae UAMH 11346]